MQSWQERQITMSDYIMIPRFPDVTNYCRLRIAAGLTPKTPEAAAAGLPNTWYGVSFLYHDEVVGMARIIGDGGCFFQFVDGAIEPAHQGRGLGARFMRALVDHLREHAPPSAYVTGFADGTTARLYARYGFTPAAPGSIGIHLRL
jgi:GNAT superfamily N-acetyltransferase